jgi:hypothetical protein
VSINVPSVKEIIGAKVEISSSGNDSAEQVQGGRCNFLQTRAFDIAHDVKWHIAGAETDGDLAFEVSAETKIHVLSLGAPVAP